MVSSTRVPRAHTLPNSNRSLTLSTIDLNNAINNNQLLRTRSPGGGQSVSIMSLPQSDDNEAFSFDNSALQLEDENEDIHLSLSPSASPIPDEAVFDDIDLNSSSKTTATNEVPQVPAGLSKYAVGVGYRDVRSAPTRSTSVWDSVLGCLKPVMSLMNKSGKPSNLQKSEKDEWEIPFESISDLQWLGSGAQGAVFAGKFNSELVAVKKVKELSDTNIHHLKKLNHHNIIQFRGVCTQAPVFCIVMEYCPYGPLFNFLRNGKDKVPPTRFVEWTKQIASGVKYLHDHKIIHRDLKSPNVLIGRNEILKISDFGTSRTWGEQSTCMSFAGTVAWMAPEVIRNEPCNEKVDIWSFGVLLWELLTCEIPYQNVDSSAIIWGVGSNKLYLPIPTTCPEGYKLLIKQCWANKPRNRPSFKNILMHLDIASVEILSYQPEDYFRTQQSWKKEVWEYNEKVKGEDSTMPLADHDLIKKRKQELKHVQDIKEHYEKKLDKVQDLYVELETWRLQLEEKQRNLERKEKQLNIQSSKVYYKKKPKPLVISKAQERLQKRTAALKSPISTTPDGGRSTSPESPFKLPPSLQMQPSPSRIGAAASASVVDSSQYSNRPQTMPKNELTSSQHDSRPEESDDPFDEPDTKTPNAKPNTLEIQSGQYHPTAEQLKVRKPRHRRTGSHGSSNYAYGSPRISPMRERRVSAQSPYSPRRISQGSFVDFESNNNDNSAALYPNRLQVHRRSWNGNTTTSPDLTRRDSTTSSSSADSAEECHIDDAAADDDILETLDRKVSEVINRSRMDK